MGGGGFLFLFKPSPPIDGTCSEEHPRGSKIWSRLLKTGPHLKPWVPFLGALTPLGAAHLSQQLTEEVT